MNLDPISNNEHEKILFEFMKNNKLTMKDVLNEQQVDYTFNNGRNKTWIDHVIHSKRSVQIKNVQIILNRESDENNNFSDHLPIIFDYVLTPNDNFDSIYVKTVAKKYI